jgi:hypothetical protein
MACETVGILGLIDREINYVARIGVAQGTRFDQSGSEASSGVGTSRSL